jgi:hypothetical protein
LAGTDDFMGPGNCIIAAPDEAKIQVLMPAGVARNLRVHLSAPLTLGAFTFFVRQNGVDTLITCTITAPAQECVDFFAVTTDQASFASADMLSVRSTGGGGSAPAVAATWSLNYETGVTVLVGGSGGASLLGPNATYFLGPGNGFTLTEVNVQVPVVAGTVNNLRVLLDSAEVAVAGSYTATVMKNGVATSVTCQILATFLSCSDLTNSVAFAAGDKLDLMVALALTEAHTVSFSLTLGP